MFISYIWDIIYMFLIQITTRENNTQREKKIIFISCTLHTPTTWLRRQIHVGCGGCEREKERESEVDTVTIWIVVLSLGHKAMYTVISHILGAAIFLYNWSWSRIPLRKWRIFSLILLSSFFWVYDTFAIPNTTYTCVFVFCVLCARALCMTVNKSDRRCISISASKHVSYLGPSQMYWKTRKKTEKQQQILVHCIESFSPSGCRWMRSEWTAKRRNKAMKLIKIVFSVASLLSLSNGRKIQNFCSLLSLLQ